MLSYYLSLIEDDTSRTLFEQIYHLHHRTMIHVANQILHDQMLAEDAAHDAFLRILNHLEKISEADCNKTRSFVVLIVKNIAIDYYRRQKRRAESNLEDYAAILADNQVDPEKAFQQKENSQEMLTGISQLHQSYADVLSLKVAFEYHDEEIAHLLGITPANVRVRLHRARQQLSRNLVKGDTEYGPDK